MGESSSSKKPTHSPIGASTMYRWSACPGSVQFCKDIPSKQSKFAVEGSQAHEVAALCLKNQTPPNSMVGKEFIYNNEIFLLTEEMAEAVQIYYDEVMGLFSRCDSIQIEKSFDLSEKVYPGLYGTADAVLYNLATKTLWVLDYKHGAGVPVDVVGNPQLRYYALGALVTAGYPCKEVMIGVVQPRAPHTDGPIRYESVPVLELMDFENDLVQYAKETEKKNAKLIPGDHCGFCPGASLCPSLHSKAVKLCKSDFSIIDKEPTGISQDRLATIKEALDWVPTIKDWVRSVEEFSYNLATSGTEIPGYKIVEKRKTRRWKDNVKPFTIANSLGIFIDEVTTDPELKSPAQIEKLIPKDKHKILNEFIVAESSGTTLVPDSDKREAVKNAATLDFTPIGEKGSASPLQLELFK